MSVTSKVLVVIVIGCAAPPEQLPLADSVTTVPSVTAAPPVADSTINWSLGEPVPDSVTADWLVRRYRCYHGCSGPPVGDPFWARQDVVAAIIAADTAFDLVHRANAFVRIATGGHRDAISYLTALADSAGPDRLRRAAIITLEYVPRPLPARTLEVLQRRAEEHGAPENQTARRILDAHAKLRRPDA